MKFRGESDPLSEREESELVSEVRRLAASAGDAKPSGPAGDYWPGLIVRTNALIDRATSGKAISISWAARVAIPGVVAIVSFLIALHYYVPEVPMQNPSVRDVVLSLPPAAIDSMLIDPSRIDPSLSVADVSPDVFEFSRDQIAQYLVANDNASAAVDGMSDREANELLAVLGAGLK